MNNSWTTTSKLPLAKEDKNVAQKNELQALDQVVVYPANEKWNSLFKAVFTSVKAFHLSAFLLPALSKYSNRESEKEHVHSS